MIGVAREDDAQRIMDVLPKRMSKYGLTVHPEKTRLVRFEPPQARRLRNRGTGPTRTEDIRLSGIYSLLGTIPARCMGGQTEDGEEPTSSRVSSAVTDGVGKICTFDQGAAPEAHGKAAGHYGYYGIIGNFSSLRNSGGSAKESGDASCLGDAEAGRGRGPDSFVWRSDTIFPSARGSGPRLSEPAVAKS